MQTKSSVRGKKPKNTGVDFDAAVIVNPKRHTDGARAQDSRFFPYYAGYSTTFAANLLASLKLPPNADVLDPWNGSGTTTQTARRLGYKAIGYDLNPAMVLVAKAGVLSPLEVGSLTPLARTILESAYSRTQLMTEDDPLCAWLVPTGTSFIRAIEFEINNSLVSHGSYQPLVNRDSLSQVSSLAAFFYVCLFRVTRRLLSNFIPTNPTWTKVPSKPYQRKRPEKQKIVELFLAEVELLAARVAVHGFTVPDEARACSISLGNSEELRLPNHSIDAVITSPPYCTRIDYAMATIIELAVLRLDKPHFDVLRRKLMGNATVTRGIAETNKAWGRTCNNFLNRLYTHSSKASRTYYFKNHIQYYGALHKSLGELARVLKTNGKCVIVAQDSYYKDVHNDVPQIISEMAECHGLRVVQRVDFSSNRSMVGMNTRARSYISDRKISESVLCFVPA